MGREAVSIPNLESVKRLTRDINKASAELSYSQARELVDAYYRMQEFRKTLGNQSGALTEEDRPNAVTTWLCGEIETLENQVKRAMDTFTKSKPIGVWSREIKGIGPVLAGGLMAHIDMEKAPTAGHIWRFAGLDPTCEWKKGEKRPFNAALKVLCWKIGESFVKVSNNPDSFYGKVYKERKALEEQRNENGDFKTQAEEKLKKFNIGKDTDAYKAYSQGKLPPAHIHARAKRYAVKLFLAHWHEMNYRYTFDKEPPAPYPIAILGHAHHIKAELAS